MRKIACLFISVLCLFAACSDDSNKPEEDPTHSTVAVTGEAGQVGIISATMQAWANTDLLPAGDTISCEAGIEYDIHPDFSTAIAWQPVQLESRLLTRTINCLPETRYFFRAFVRAGGQTYYGETKSFQTLPMAQIAQAGSVQNLYYTKAIVQVEVDENLLDSAFTAGTYGKRTNYEIYHDVALLYTTDPDALGHVDTELPKGVRRIWFTDQGETFLTEDEGARKTFTTSMKGLLPDTTYYYCAATVAYEKKSFKAYKYLCGDIRSFTTHGTQTLQELETGDTEDVTFRTATIRWTTDYDFARSVMDDAESAGVEYCTDTRDFENGRQRFATEGVRPDSTGTGFHVTFGGLQNGTLYYYRSYVLTGDTLQYGPVRTFRTKGGDDVDLSAEWTDLGLGCLWANRNVEAQEAQDAGGYYPWGIAESMQIGLTEKRGTEIIEIAMKEGSICGDPNYDMATIIMGEPWRMPSQAETTELRERCAWQKATRGGREGYLVFGPNGNIIFLPKTGWYKTEYYNQRLYPDDPTLWDIHKRVYTITHEDTELPYLWSGDIKDGRLSYYYYSIAYCLGGAQLLSFMLPIRAVKDR